MVHVVSCATCGKHVGSECTEKSPCHAFDKWEPTMPTGTIRTAESYDKE